MLSECAGARAGRMRGGRTYLALLYKDLGDAAKSPASFERAASCSRTICRRWCGWAMPISIKGGRRLPSRCSSRRCRCSRARLPRCSASGGPRWPAGSDYAGGRAISNRRCRSIPKRAVIHYPLAMAYRGMGNLEQAEAHLRQRGPGEHSAARSADASSSTACWKARSPTKCAERRRWTRGNGRRPRSTSARASSWRRPSRRSGTSWARRWP